MRKSRCRPQIIAAAALAALPALRAHAVDASQPAIIQIFEATHRTIEKRAPDIFMAGYGGIWTPPPGRAQGGQSVGYDVYDRFDLGSAGNPTFYGTETGLKTAINELHKGSVNVYTDLVWNHNAFWDQDTTNFNAAGGYPGLRVTQPGDAYGDFHTKGWTGDFYGRLAGLIDIAHEKSGGNYHYIRNPVPGFANNIPAGTPGLFSRTANIPTEANRRFYPDLQGPSTTVNGVTYFHWNSANPSAGDPVAENVTGYLMRHTRWMIEEIGVDGFRLDATKHIVQYVDSNGNIVNNPDWILEFYDVATNAGTKTPYLNGTRKRVFGFGEYADGNIGAVQNSIKKDANANRDALDFILHYRVKDNLTGNGNANDWRNVVNNTQDLGDGGHNGSQGVTFDRSHDDGGAYLTNVANAFYLMRPGNAVVYFNAKEFGNGREFPADGHGDALGGLYGNVLTKLVEIRGSHGRGNYRERWLDKETYVMERSDALVAGYNNRLDAGYDTRTFNVDFAPGTRLIELTGNAESVTVDPNNDIFDFVTVDPGTTTDGRVTIRIPRNKAPGTNGAQHNKGYVIYGPATPRGTLAVTNVSHTIAGETPTANTNGTARLSSFEVIRQNSFQVQLQTNHVIIGGVEDLEAGGDNAVLRFDGGIDLNGNGVVDSSNPNVDAQAWPTTSSYGFDNFVTEKSPIYSGGSGLYRQTIDTTTLSEGFHYITARAYRRRAGAGTPLWTDFRNVIYVDRLPVEVSLDSAKTIAGQPTRRNLVFKNADKTAQTVRVFANVGVNEYTLAQLLALPANDPNAAGNYDRDLFNYGIDWNNGNHAYTVVTFEPSYDPALGVAGGGVNIQRFAGLLVNDGSGAGFGDLNSNGVLGIDDQGTFQLMLGGVANPINPNTSFHPAADLNADGLVDEADNILNVPWLAAQGASPGVITEATKTRVARALVQTSGELNVPAGPLNVSGATVQGVPITITASFGIGSGKTLTKTGGESFTIAGTQTHQANSTLLTTGGTTNLNTNGGVNLAVNTSGAASATNFAVTQNLRSITVADGAVATLTTTSGHDVNGGKALHTKSLTALTGKLDLNNNNLAVNYTGLSPMGALVGGEYTGLLGMLQDGSNHGLWNGATGIASSSAAANDLRTVLAAAEASAVLGLTGSQTAIWYGHTVDATTVLLEYTWGGDANLDGRLNADDYFQINANYNKPPSGHFTGDFDYSGVIDGDDFFIIDSNYALQLGSIAAAPPAGAGSAAGVQSVPEPAGALLMLAPMALAMRRSRRRRHHSLESPPSR